MMWIFRGNDMEMTPPPPSLPTYIFDEVIHPVAFGRSTPNTQVAEMSFDEIFDLAAEVSLNLRKYIMAWA